MSLHAFLISFRAIFVTTILYFYLFYQWLLLIFVIFSSWFHTCFVSQFPRVVSLQQQANCVDQTKRYDICYEIRIIIILFYVINNNFVISISSLNPNLYFFYFFLLFFSMVINLTYSCVCLSHFCIFFFIYVMLYIMKWTK